MGGNQHVIDLSTVADPQDRIMARVVDGVIVLVAAYLLTLVINTEQVLSFMFRSSPTYGLLVLDVLPGLLVASYFAVSYTHLTLPTTPYV